MGSNFLSNMFGGIFGFNDPDSVRIANYAKHARLYDGYTGKVNLSQTGMWKRLDYNLSVPIVNAATDFLAKEGIGVSVTDDDTLTALCEEYWKQSGGNDLFGLKVRSAIIKGDAVIMPGVRESDGQTYMKWINPVFCRPTFDPHDMDLITSLVIAYEIPAQGSRGRVLYREVWADGSVRYYEGDVLTKEATYDQEIYGGYVPCVWVRNEQVDDEFYGRSELYNVAMMIEKYDHLKQKEDRQTDYHLAPNIAVTGVGKDALSMTKGERTMYFLPENGDMKFIEWQGTTINTRASIDEVRNAICVISETPEIVLQRYEGIGTGDVSGVALRLLYGPLIAKTDRKKAVWGQALAKAFRMCLLTDGITDVAVEDITIEFANPLPTNEKEKWEVVQLKQAAGVSKRTSLEESGYTKEEVDEIEQEREEEDKASGASMLKSFNKGAVDGNPYPDGQGVPPKPTEDAPTESKSGAKSA